MAYDTKEQIELRPESFALITTVEQANAFIDEQVEIIKKTVGNDRVLLALSGGVDSSVVAALLIKAIGRQLTCVHVNHGLLRKGEPEEVIRVFRNEMNADLVYVDAAERFLGKLANVSDPERKRKIIGNEFIEVFDEESKKLEGIKWLAQGTIYPDILESINKKKKEAEAAAKAPVETKAEVVVDTSVPATSPEAVFECNGKAYKTMSDAIRAIINELTADSTDVATAKVTVKLLRDYAAVKEEKPTFFEALPAITVDLGGYTLDLSESALLNTFPENKKNGNVSVCNGNVNFGANGIVNYAERNADSDIIKSHHNVGGLPAYMQLKLLEPIKLLYKDEVRLVGSVLGLPDDMVYRQPFPGPGLGVRCTGAITADRLEAVRESDAILREEFAKWGLEGKVWQYFTVVPDCRSVGIKNEKRSFAYSVIIRAVNTKQAITASIEPLPYELLEVLTKRMTTEIENVNRVLYDLTPKPTGTIEWE